MQSMKPRKQHKARLQAELHVRHKLIAAHLAKAIRVQLKRRSLPLRKGDEVKVARGTYKGKEGKVAEVDLKALKIYVEGIVRKQVSGKEVQVALEPSNLIITNPVLEDPRRKLVIDRSRVTKASSATKGRQGE
jgi:large subunit ribosomal protein L24